MEFLVGHGEICDYIVVDGLQCKVSCTTCGKWEDVPGTPTVGKGDASCVGGGR